MKIAVYGATGAIGSAVVDEARSRGHEVTGISRRGSGEPSHLAGDALDTELATAVAEKHDVIVSAIGPSRVSDDGTRFVDSIDNLVATLGDRRLVVVGGAGSLEVDGVRLVDSPHFPEAYKGEALKGAASLALLRDASEDVDWTYLSPAPVILPGERTGSYQVAIDTPAGEQISVPDYAVALLDEIEHPQHVRRRFTVAN
ncbi:NAD(P)-dependent oxidoreductase [Nocardioides bizhenqiangii]|uniref:NAD(P)H-binding protein n=1 Tax=Nocardioides bizhenqiangii TaxID=3095076 RepID=A0ABZ0ZQW2_9ACTN|nr:NAD(P)H-binding protein [Nocardioides sp. HM61]WQQ26696.1 NAD(P)H-binding protein [Nocardioides sp. HM61]